MRAESRVMDGDGAVLYCRCKHESWMFIYFSLTKKSVPDYWVLSQTHIVYKIEEEEVEN